MTGRYVLVYESNHTADLFEAAISKAFPHLTIRSISDFRGLSDIWLGEYLYNSANEGCETSEISEGDIKDIIARDRVLRDFEKSRSERIVKRLICGFQLLFEMHSFSLVFSIAIDRCSTDILERLARNRDIPFISPVGAFIPGYSRFTSRGELIPLKRDISQEEINETLNLLLCDSFLPLYERGNKTDSFSVIRKVQVRRWVIEHLYYPLVKRMKHDPDNIYYNMTYFRNCTLGDILFSDPYRELSNTFEAKFNQKRTVYVPLHVTPEATTDYWCNTVAQEGYENYILRIIDKSDASIQFVIKEHPSMYKYGRRNEGFYANLMERHNVILLGPSSNSNKLLDAIDAVLVSVGTVGIESLLRGKKVFALENSYYSGFHPNCIQVEGLSEKNFIRSIESYDNNLFIRNLLQGMFRFDGSTKASVEIASDQLARALVLL